MEMKKFLLPRALQPIPFAIAALAFLGCAHYATVTIPPAVELSAYDGIALIEFASQPPGQLGPEATKMFINNLHGAQPGVRILEIGSQAAILKELGYDKLDIQAVKAIGERFGVTAVLTGTAELSEPQHDVSVSSGLSVLAAGVDAKVKGRMSAELRETASGATTWSNSSWGSWTVGGVRLASSGQVSAGYSYPKDKQEEILVELVRALNGEFWPSYEKRKVEK